MILLSIISYGKILDKISFYVSGIFCNFKNFVSNFVVKFDPMINLIRKLT
jgi:hypothetical protein